MTQEATLTTDLLTIFHVKALSKGKGSLETVANGNSSTIGASGPATAPTEGSNKRKRKTVDSTTRSPHGTPRHSPHSFSIWLGSMSAVGAPSVPLVPLGNSKISRGVQVGLTLTEENMLVTIPRQDLFSVAF